MSIPKATGPFQVGCCDIMTKAKNIPKDFEPKWLCAEYTNLGILVDLYYPCKVENKSDLKLAPWIPTQNHKSYCNGTSVHTFRTSWFSFVVEYMQRGFTQNALIDAPLIDEISFKSSGIDVTTKKGKFPLVIFSHGLSACRTFYSAFCTELASYGFIVASIEHRDGSACASSFIDPTSGQHIEVPYYYEDVTDDGDETKFLLRNMQLLKRVREIGELLDLLSELNTSPENIENMLDSDLNLTKFKNRIDVENPMIFGHSFGAATALNVLQTDKRFKCAICMDIWTVPLGPDIYCKMSESRSCLFIMTDCFKSKKNVDRLKMYEERQEKDFMETVTIKRSGHMDQTDSPPIIPRILSWVFGKDLGPRNYEEGMKLQRDLVMAFFMKYLKENVSPIKLLDDGFVLDEAFVVGYSMD